MMQPPRRFGAIALMLGALMPMMMPPPPRREGELLRDLPPEHRDALLRAEVSTGVAIDSQMLRELGFKPPPVERNPIDDIQAAAKAVYDSGNRAHARQLRDERTRAVVAAPCHAYRQAKPCFRCERSQYGKCRAHRAATARGVAA